MVNKASVKDVNALVKIQRVVYPDNLNVAMGDYFLKEFFKVFMEFPGYKALIARKDTEPVGYLLGYPYDKRNLLDKHLSSLFMKSIIRNPLLVFKKPVFRKIVVYVKKILIRTGSENTERLFDIDYSKAYYMFLIAITPDGRGLDLGRKLMLTMQELAEEDGYEYFLGSVASDNKKVLHLWSTIGYSVIDVPGDNDKYVFKDATKK